MILSCDTWCHLHISATRIGDGVEYVHRAIVVERTPRRGRPVRCHSIRMRSVYETPAYLVEETSLTGVSECEHRKTIASDRTSPPCHNRFFVEIRQTAAGRPERFGFAVPEEKGLSYEAARPLNPFPTDAEVLCYIASHKDLMDSFGADPKRGREHYRKHGRMEGRTVTFEPLRYVASHPDLFHLGIDRSAACRHFIRHGRREARPITFDPFAYLAGYPDLLESIPHEEDKIVEHYIKIGYPGGRHCHAFSWRDYFRLNPDLVDEIEYTQQAAAEHYVLKGYEAKRQVA